MSTSSIQQSFESSTRVSQSLRNDRCQNILYKAVFEHFKETRNIATLLLASKSFQNSSFGANFLVNFVVDKDSIRLLESVLSPSSCFSLQLVPSLHIKRSMYNSDKVKRGISYFVRELVNSKYFHLSLRSLSLEFLPNEVLSFFFANSTNTNTWPQLRDLTLENCDLNDAILELIANNAVHLRAVRFTRVGGITDAGIEHISKLASITSLNLCCCDLITDAGLEHVAKLPNITFLGLRGLNELTGAGIEHLSQLSDINSLDLSFCKKITDTGLVHVAKLSGITSLNLTSCENITDAGLKSVAKLSSITSLQLIDCINITDAGLEHISKLSKITSLNLDGCSCITDVGLEHIAKLSSITSLSLFECFNITAEATIKLKTTLPKCNVFSDISYPDDDD